MSWKQPMGLNRVSFTHSTFVCMVCTEYFHVIWKIKSNDSLKRLGKYILGDSIAFKRQFNLIIIKHNIFKVAYTCILILLLTCPLDLKVKSLAQFDFRNHDFLELEYLTLKKMNMKFVFLRNGNYGKITV